MKKYLKNLWSLNNFLLDSALAFILLSDCQN